MVAHSIGGFEAEVPVSGGLEGGGSAHDKYANSLNWFEFFLIR